MNISTPNKVRTVKTQQVVDAPGIREETVVTDSQVDPDELMVAKIKQAIWLVIHFFGFVIGFRFIFLLFAANLSGFSLFIYNLSTPFVRPFEGIFAAPSAGGSYFDSAALLALAVWYLLGYLITYVIALLTSRSKHVEV